MSSLFENINEVDCAYKCVNDYQEYYLGWPLDQVVSHLLAQGNTGEAEALQAALAIIHKYENQQAIALALIQQKKTKNAHKISAALPAPPTQTHQQKLKATTLLTPLPSIVSEGFAVSYRGINWAHYENILKLFALNYLIQGEMTPQQQKDKEDLTRAIESAGNAKYKKKRLTAQQIIERDSGVYLRFGKNVIRAMAEPNPIVSERRLKDLRSEIADTRNENNAIQLHKTMSKAKTIFMTMQSRYNQK